MISILTGGGSGVQYRPWDHLQNNNNLNLITKTIMAEIKKRYSDEDLAEFQAIIEEKLARSRRDYNDMMRALRNDEGNDVADTSPTYKILEEGATTQNKAELIMLAQRQQKFIQGLEAALIRIANKTYGIDRMTGELIPKERLRAVPHATLSVESKMKKDH